MISFLKIHIILFWIGLDVVRSTGNLSSDSNGKGFGDIWWTDKLIYFSSIDYNGICGNAQ